MKNKYQRMFALIAVTFSMFTATAQMGIIRQQVLDEKGRPTLVEFNTAAKGYYASESKQLFQEVLNLTVEESYQETSFTEDELGMTHQKFQQTYKGYPVEFGTYTIHAKEGNVFALSGAYQEARMVDLAPVLTEDEALEKALAYVNANTYMWEMEGNEQWIKAEKKDKNASWFPKAQMVIVNNVFAKTKEAHEMPSFAYKFDIYAAEPVSRAYIYVDAKTGNIVNYNSIIKSVVAQGNGDTRYSGNKNFVTDSYNSSYRLRDYSRGNGIITYDMNTSTNYNSAVDFTDSNNSWTYSEYHNTAKDDIAMECHWAFQQIYDYWLNVHSRNSYDNNGALMKAYVHFDSQYDNAYWNGSVFTFGDGSDTYFDALACLDVSAHEHGHAICSYTADLNYQNESGALNEAFSDIWGACVEAYAAPEKQTWVMGEDIERRTGHDGLRILSDPKAEGLPDTYLGINWYPTTTNPTSSNDYGGVHYNNGPFCYWFYLVSEGGSGTNDNGDSYSITSLGISKAEQIAWRMESVYMSASSDYSAARTYAIQSATDLYGAASNEVIQVTNAMYAIGVGDPYGGGTASYCASKGSNYSYEWIAGVTIGTFSNTSGAAGYTNYTSQTVELTPGQSYNVTLTPGFASTTYNEYWKIWIDYNGDMDFADAGELVYDAGALSKTAVSGTITIPSSATGTTRMRVSMKYNGAQTECETFSYGEVEDYTVQFTSGGGTDTQAPTAPSNLTASNVTQTTVDLSWSASTDNVGVTGYIVYQGTISLGTTTGTSAQITGLTAGSAYTFSVKAQDAAGNISAASNTVNVTTQSASDTQAPTAPTGLTASGITSSGLTLSWNASSDNVGVTGYQVYQNGSLAKTVTSTSTSLTGLSAGTTYSYYVKATDAAGNVSSASSTINATTLSGSVSYCASKGSNSSYEWIDLVRLGGIDNTSGNDGGYIDNTAMVGTVALGANTIYLSCGFSGSSYTEYWHVWIDLNHDGTFGTDERLVYGSSSSSGTLSATLTIPTTATLGQTRMRVTMKYNSAATACETFSYGEVEDYTVNIVSSTYGILAGASEPGEALSNDEMHDFRIYPNPASNDLNIEFAEIRDVTVHVYDIAGRLVMGEQLFGQNESLDISSLENGIYTLVLTNNEKQITARFIKQ